MEEHFKSARLARMQEHQFQFIIYLTSNDYVQIVCRQESRSQQLQWDPRLKKKMYTRRGVHAAELKYKKNKLTCKMQCIGK